ncbi:MAG: Gfo/Idh/MocA family protein [Candidatus Bipolaricaulaceae bacterium]
MRPVTVAVLGAGNRGSEVYADYVSRNPHLARLVAVAEPNEARRAQFARRYGLPLTHSFPDWATLLDRGRLADALVVATPDHEHVAPAVRAVGLGYHVLLEKPVATDVAGLSQLLQAARSGPGSITVSHVLRYTPFFSTIKDLIEAGRIGRLVCADHQENIGYWHFAHSYVRGNWRRQADSAPMILAKACHDFDLLRWFTGQPCRRVSSFGALVHFRPENAPPEAAPRCTDPCPVEPDCPYSAVRLYVRDLAGWEGWPVSVVTSDFSPAGRLQALRDGPYGRCVYQCDNDVVDHQVVGLEFADGTTAALTVCGFTAENTRTVKLMGTRGEIRGHLASGEIDIWDFRSGERTGVQVEGGPGHAGGDQGLMRAFLERTSRLVRGEAPAQALTSLEESVDSHLMALAAERARREGKVVNLDSLRGGLGARLGIQTTH